MAESKEESLTVVQRYAEAVKPDLDRDSMQKLYAEWATTYDQVNT